MGKGSGTGCCAGCGQGEGDGNVFIGSSFAVVCSILFCACGLPMLLAGIILTAFGPANTWVLYYRALVALILIVLLCTGKLHRNNRVQTSSVVNSTSYNAGIRRQNQHPVMISQPPPYTSNNPPPYSQIQNHPESFTGRPPTAQQTLPGYGITNPTTPPNPVYPPPNYERY
ncbi:hypothetical protein LSH36_37g01015 [Paralvinella palmiformis]|uniref:Transmembrane protein n=1 Tax=Paralvinella palmiformis TaxID=53620 RepID=A0AAD9K8C1_9ANNE|nr:hypothetical protein LSH36_37g01015 [Paralvinella palmiformis]